MATRRRGEFFRAAAISEGEGVEVLGTAPATTRWTETRGIVRTRSREHVLEVRDWTIDGVPLRRLVSHDDPGAAYERLLRGLLTRYRALAATGASGAGAEAP